MEFDSNNSPFIRLPAPLQDIIITPPLYSDGDAVIKILSDPKVYMKLAGPPYPYGQKEWDEWFPLIEKVSSDALVEYLEVEKAKKESVEGRRWVNGTPIRTIRAIDPVTREQKCIGTIDPTRTDFVFHGAREENRRKQTHNDGLEVGSPEIEWCFGCESFLFLSSSYQQHTTF
jgi:hypothetical protein